MALKSVWKERLMILAWAVALVVAVSPTPSCPLEMKARLTLVVGRVTVDGPGTAPDTSAVARQTLRQGDVIRTGPASRAEIALPGGRGVIRAAEHSLLILVVLGEADSLHKTEAHLRFGRVWINLRVLKKLRDMEERQRDFQVTSPVAVSGVRGTVYRMDVAPDSTSQVRVYEGNVQVGWVPQQAFVPGLPILKPPEEVAGPREITAAEWIELIRAGQEAVLTPDRKASVSRFDATKDAQDEWVKWNRARDE